jgi:hypothetical protein
MSFTFLSKINLNGILSSLSWSSKWSPYKKISVKNVYEILSSPPKLSAPFTLTILDDDDGIYVLIAVARSPVTVNGRFGETYCFYLQG